MIGHGLLWSCTERRPAVPKKSVGKPIDGASRLEESLPTVYQPSYPFLRHPRQGRPSVSWRRGGFSGPISAAEKQLFQTDLQGDLSLVGGLAWPGHLRNDAAGKKTVPPTRSREGAFGPQMGLGGLPRLVPRAGVSAALCGDHVVYARK